MTPGIVAPRRLAYVRLQDLRPSPGNAKNHVIPRIIAYMDRFGWTAPVLVCDRVERIAAGHGRVAAAIEMRAQALSPPAGVLVDDDGEWLIPTIRGWSSRDDTELSAYLIADNKSSADGGWDDRLLVAELEKIHAADAVLFDELAFSHEDLDELFRLAQGDAAGDPAAPDPMPTGTPDAGDDLGDVDTSTDPAEPSPAREVECPACGEHFALGAKL